jgi:hypothetical protein
MSEEDIDFYKKTVLIFEEIRDITKRINELSDEAVKILNNPIALMTNGLEKVEKNIGEIQLKFLTLNSFLLSLDKGE